MKQAGTNATGAPGRSEAATVRACCRCHCARYRTPAAAQSGRLGWGGAGPVSGQSLSSVPYEMLVNLF